MLQAEQERETFWFRCALMFEKLTLKGIGEVTLQMPRDRLGAFQTQVVPK
ncbi:MAG: hypothetical protein OEY59_06415 [Deltaproteobacteria bacterium]|nr:hypothetical protein [Deltaproteobacteria bacterium]